MKILLVQPPVRDFFESAERLAPVGLAYIKAAVGKYIPDAAVEILDARAGRARRTTPLPPELRFLSEYYGGDDTGPFALFTQYYHFGLNYNYVAAEAANFTPDLVGISCLFSAYYAEALDTAAAIKKVLPRIPIVLGGPHASAAPESVLVGGIVDYVVMGEGERPMVELAKALAGGGAIENVPNLAWVEAGQIRFTAREPNYPVEELGAPDLSGLDPGHYRIGRRNLATVVTSRGCPHGCDFCSSKEIFGAAHRRRRTASVIDEMSERLGQGFEAFDFEDDNLASPSNAFSGLLSAIIEEFGERNLRLSAMNGINYQALDGGTLDLMRRAGFDHLNLSLVSADDALCAGHGRAGSSERFETIARLAAQVGLLTTAYQVLGLPGEDMDSMLDGLALLASLPVLIGVSPFYLTPGMALWSGKPTRERLMRARLTALGPDSPECSRRDVFTLLISARILNFLKGLELSGEVPFSEALESARSSGVRAAAGADLLDELLKTGTLRSWNKKPGPQVKMFDQGLFFRLWSRIGRLENRKGGIILLA